MTSLEAYSEEQARKIHAKKKLYCVLTGNKDRPFAFIEINNDFYGVSFLDENLRCKLDYQFVVQENSKLFLQMSTYREFLEDTDKVINGTTYIFKQNGVVHIQNENFEKNEFTESESKFDIESNWEIVPEFGNYGNLLKIER